MSTHSLDPLPMAQTVKLAERIAFSRSFQPIFNEGMGLVDETATYLDGPGRAEVKSLSTAGATLYAAESMRLTTRLMQIASWLLLQRAANQGDMSRAQVEAEKVKVRLDAVGSSRDLPIFVELPEQFRALVDRTINLETRISLLDREIYGEPDLSVSRDPVGEQRRLLETAFAV